MVDMLMLTKKHQEQQQQQQPHKQQQQQQNIQHEQQLFSRRKNKTLQQKDEEREEDFYYTLTKIKTKVNKIIETTTTRTTNRTCFANTVNKICTCCCSCCCSVNNITLKYHYNKWKSIKSNDGFSVGVVCGGGSGLWLVLLVFMLILCGNPAISQQRNINNSIKQNNSNNIANILLQISTQPPLNVVAEATQTTNYNRVAVSGNNGGGGGGGVGVGIIVADNEEKQVFYDDTIRQRQRQLQLPAKSNVNTKTTISSSTSSSSSSSSSFSSSSSSRSSSSVSNNAPTLGISNSATNNNNNNNNYNRNNLKSNNNETLLNNGESISAASTNSNNNDNDDNNSNSSEDLLNSAEILNESEDGYEHSTSTTPRSIRSTIAPALTAAQERERRLMNVLAARRSALQRPGFRNRIGTTGRTATAVETTSKSPTDPRSICIRNCTKNFTRRTTASCMRQCANFSKVSSSIPGAASSTVVVKNSSKTGTGTAQAGEKDTNEILFTDESSHGLLVIAKEQNDTLNHINDDKKSGVASKLRGRRKPQNQLGTVTLATTSIEEDEIQPYLYFGQKLPPLKPHTLTITSVSDEHPKLLEVSAAEAETSSTTPVAVKSTLSWVEKSRSRYNYSMRSGLTSTRKYSSLNRTTTPQVPTDLRTTTLRIVAEKEPKLKILSLRKTTTPKPVTQALKEEQVFSPSTPLIITVLGDEDIVTPTPEPLGLFNVKIAEALRESTTLPTTTVKQSKNTNPTTTTTTTTIPYTTTTTRKTTIIPTMLPTTTENTSTTTSTTTKPITSTTTESTTTTTTTTNTPILPIYRAAIYQPPIPFTTTTTSTPAPTTTPTANPIITTQKTILSEKDTEILREIGASLAEPINTDDTNLIIFVNRTTDIYRAPSHKHVTTTTQKPHIHLETFIPQQQATTDSSTTILHTTILTSIRSTINSRNKDLNIQSTTAAPTASSQRGPTLNPENSSPSSTTQQPVITGEISSTVVTDDQEISLEMHRMNIVTMVLAGIGIVPLLAIIVYLLRNYLLKRPLKDDEDFDVCITDQQPISPVKKIDAKYQEDDEDEIDHHQKKPPQRQHSLHSKLVSAPLARDNNHNLAQNQQRYDDKSSVTSDQEFDRTNIRLKSLLGEGNFGQVWKAEADDLSGHFGATRIVAVKTIKACSTQLSLKDEANIMRKLGSHQNVVTLLGACVDSEPHMLIMEYAMRGRLLSLLRAARNATNILPASVPGGRSLTPLSPRTLAGFCLDIARGMEYIAEKRIVHRDLAARNVLLDHNGVCKICDFGMSIDLDAERKRKELEKNCANEIMRSNFNKFKFDFGGKFIMNHWPQHSPKECNEKKSHGHDTIGKRPALPIRWMAPEALQYNIFSTETDIWAFGIVLWEIATLGSTPYSQITGREVIRRVPQGLRPDLPKEGRHEFYNLMSRCWHKDPHMRPSLSQCRLEISRSLHKWVDDDSAASDYMDVSGFSEDLEQGMVYFNHRISEFECEI